LSHFYSSQTNENQTYHIIQRPNHRFSNSSQSKAGNNNP
jgi:hypothetical protein